MECSSDYQLVLETDINQIKNLQTTINVNSFIFNKEDIKNDNYVKKNYPLVYILYDSQKIYIGETSNALVRIKNHLCHPEKKKLKNIYIISSPYFNKSCTLDIESRLIEYLSADPRFTLLNGNGGTTHNYYQKESYYEFFKKIWSKLSFGDQKMKKLSELYKTDIFKYSPYKSLSQDQYESVNEILKSFSKEDVSTIFINGSAGTGKTILAIYIVKLLKNSMKKDLGNLDIDDEELLSYIKDLKIKFKNDMNIALVVPMSSLRETLKKVFKNVHGLSQSMVIGPSEVVKNHYDLLIVDESHRLSRRKGIMAYGAFDKTNTKLSLDKEATQLDWIMKSSKYQIFFYDSEQSIKPADVREEDVNRIKGGDSVKEVKLVSQMRIKGGDNYLEFVDNLLYNRTEKLKDKKFESSNYDLRLFDDMKLMMREIKKREVEYGLSRTLSGYSWPWVSKNDKTKPDIIIDGVELRWNKTNSDWINSTQDVTEMGCIHTTQGYDLNYSAIIFGKEISYDPDNNSIIANKENYYDKKGKESIKEPSELLSYVIKIYKTMMFRGIKGTYLYVCDKNLREYFKKYIETF